MRLATYLKQQGLSDAEFGRRVGAHRTRVWIWKIGRGSPRAEFIAAIERETRGQVGAKDFAKAS